MAMNRILFGSICTLVLICTNGPISLRAQTASSCAQSVVVQSGDTLSGLAGRYLDNYGAYLRILEATNAAAKVDASYATIQSANIISVGWKICIPAGDRSSTATSPASSVNVAATPTSLPTAVSTPLPQPPELDWDTVALHSLTIESMRRKNYPGSDLVIEQTLAAGVNYRRHVASYQSDGLKIFGLLTIPNGSKPATGWPIILFNHGYIPPQIYRTTERYVAYQDAFARSGYITFKSDYRGHGSSEGDDPEGNRYAAYTADVLNAMSSLQRHPDADANRIGMWGHSMGGQITLRAMVVSDAIKAGVIWAGTVAPFPVMYDHWQERARTSPSWGQRTRRWRDELVAEYGTPDENPDFWAAISPNTYLADLSGPIQLQHGTTDSSVPFEYSESLREQIESAAGSVEYFQYSGDNHNLSLNLQTALNRSVAFFDKYLK